MTGIINSIVASSTRTPPSGIGASFGGGYYVGLYNPTVTAGPIFALSGVYYYLIVAPKASGESSSKQYKTSNTSDTQPPTVNSQNPWDGSRNTSNINDAAHPAAEFCTGLSIGGYTDWYLPSLNELEIAYYNLKPTTASNSTIGIATISNYNALPERCNPSGGSCTYQYTTTVPGQTSVAAFQSGGAEAFAAGSYWTSTQATSLTAAWSIEFGTGGQGTTSKTNSYNVRAFRKIPV